MVAVLACSFCGFTGPTLTCRGFSCSELLCSESKYYCEECCSKQEATKRWAHSECSSQWPPTRVVYPPPSPLPPPPCSLRVKVLPQILVLHLKRFKYMEHVGRFVKLSYRVAFPFELKLFNTVSAPCISHPHSPPHLTPPPSSPVGLCSRP